MRIHRKFADLPLVVGQTVRLPVQYLNYLTRVLRLRKDDSLILFNGQDGIDYRCQLVYVSRQEIRAKILEQGDIEPVADLQIHLALSISRSERMDYALQKAVELGVSHLYPLTTEKSIVRLDNNRLQKKMGHWRGIIASACEQSGRRRVPPIELPVELHHWLENKPDYALIFDHRAEKNFVDITTPHSELGILVGPEAGWNEIERQAAVDAGCTTVRLGPRVLRTETMPLAAIAVAQALWGDFR